MTVDPRALTRLCAAALPDERRGCARADMAWVGPIGFYAKCGATINRVLRIAKLTL